MKPTRRVRPRTSLVSNVNPAFIGEQANRVIHDKQNRHEPFTDSLNLQLKA
jgi:hypothetical protein